MKLFNNDKVHNNTNALSATTDMHSWLEYDYFLVSMFYGREKYKASSMFAECIY